MQKGDTSIYNAKETRAENSVLKDSAFLLKGKFCWRSELAHILLSELDAAFGGSLTWSCLQKLSGGSIFLIRAEFLARKTKAKFILKFS